MEELIKLLIVLAVIALANIIGGLVNNIKLRKFEFSWKKLLDGILQFVGVGLMFLALAYCIETIPEIGEAAGVQPKAMIIAAITFYAKKVFEQINDFINLKKEIKANDSKTEPVDTEYMDM